MPENSIQADTGHLKRHPFLREPLLFIPQLQVQPRVNKHQLESLCQDFPDVTITIIESSPGSLSSREEGSNPTDSKYIVCLCADSVLDSKLRSLQ